MLSLTVSSTVLSGLELSIRDVCVSMLTKCANKYGFSLDDAIAEMGLRDVVKCDVVQGAAKTLRNNSKNPSEFVSAVRFPFDSQDVNCVKAGVCMSVKVNGGLYTQCGGKCVSDGLCAGCAGKASQGVPGHGSITDRLSKGTEWRDGNGRAPESYLKIMKKHGWTEEFVRSEAIRCGVVVSDIHFAEPKKRGAKATGVKDTASVEVDLLAQKRRGRPSKIAQIVESEDTTEDLFKTLQREIQHKPHDDRVPTPVMPVRLKTNAGSPEVVPALKNDKRLLDKSEKVKLKAAKDAEKAAKDAEKAAKDAEKAAKDAEKAAKDAEKAAKDAEKVKLKAAKDAEKATKDAEKTAKDAEKTAKDAEKTAKDTEKAVVVPTIIGEGVADKELEPEADSDDEDETTVLVVKQFTYNGKKYLKSDVNTVYTVDTKVPIGTWNDVSKCIEDLPEEEEEEEEEEE